MREFSFGSSIEALNQDFKRYYPEQSKKTEYEIYIDSTLGKDRDAETKDIEIRARASTCTRRL